MHQRLIPALLDAPHVIGKHEASERGCEGWVACFFFFFFLPARLGHFIISENGWSDWDVVIWKRCPRNFVPSLW
jgi:hypothetical protein